MINRRKPSLKRYAPAVFFAGAGLFGLAFWLGRVSAPDPVAADAPQAAPLQRPPDEPETGPETGPVLQQPEKEQPQDAYRVLAAAGDQLAGGMLSQRGILKMFGVMQQLDENTVIDAMREVDAMDPASPNRGLLLLAVAGRWAELDSKAAMHYAERGLTGDLRTGVITNVVSTWSETDPQAALAWYQMRRDQGELSMALGTAAQPLLAAIFQGLAARNPEAALAELSALAEGEEFRHALSGMVSAMAAAGKSEQLLEHIGRLPEARREGAREGVIRQWAHYSPKEAAHWVNRMRDSAERDRLARSVGSQWVRHDAPEAIAWMLERLPEARHPEVIADAVSIWARSDPNAAASWVGEIDPGPGIDPAIASLARQIIDRDPESAFAWASTISNPVMRDQTVDTVFAQWAIRERDAALAYLETAALEPAQRESLRALAK